MSTSNLAFYYVSTLANRKGFNLQSIALKKFISNINKNVFIDELSLDITSFNNIYEPFITRDIVFKNNSLVTRNTLLISPAHYFYYTKLVFDILLNDNARNNTTEYSFEMSNIRSYYSGMLFSTIDPNDSQQSRKILFDYSYNKFQKHLLKYEGKQGFIIDLSNFFESILISKLLNFLYSRFDHEHVSQLESFFITFNIKSLPQFHYSIASSLLSQVYLSDFDTDINKLLIEKDFAMVRFVDDMYFFNKSEVLPENQFHLIVDKINKLLWKNHLNMNPNKIEFFIEKLFERTLVESSYQEDTKFIPEKRIEEKSKILVEEDFMSFIREVNSLYEAKGYNIKEFTKLFNGTFSINNEDARKVLNNFVFSNKWSKLEDSELKYIVNNYHFIFYSPDIFFALYLKVYSYFESKHERNEKTIREVLEETDKNSQKSLRYIYSTLHYLIQRKFKRKVSKENIREFDEKLSEYIEKYVQ